MSEPPRYRFGPRDRRGLLAGARAGQVAVVWGALLAALGLLRALGGTAGVASAAGLTLLALAAVAWPVRGRSVEEWAPLAARYLVALLLGRRRAVIEGRPPARLPRPPGPLAPLAVAEVEGPGVRGAFGALHDRRSGTWTAVLSLGSSSFALLGEEERAQRVAAWSGVLAAAARSGGPVHRLQWIERTVPDRGEALARHLEKEGAPGGPAMRSYQELLEAEASGFLRHELYLACTLRGSSSAGGPAGLAEEVARLDRCCRDAAVPVEGVLSRTGLQTLLRRSFDAFPTAAPAAWAWPVAVEVSWSRVRTDGTWHATYWIAEWPRAEVASDFLLPLLVGCDERRSVSVVMAAVPPLRAVRTAEHARTSAVADAELRRRHGFAVSARRSREHEAVLQREAELADGHAFFRFSGYVTVTVADPDRLEAACARVEQAAALSRLELRRLYGAQGDSLLLTLPLGRGCG